MNTLMKKFLSFFIIILIVLSCKAFADTTYYYDNEWKTHSENVNLFINSEKVYTDIPSIIIEGRTMVPARAFFEKLGAQVDWDEDSGKISVVKNDYQIMLTVNSSTATVNGKIAQLDVPAKIITDKNATARTLIPVRFVSTWLGYAVSWDDTTKTVGIIVPQEETAPQITFIGTSCTADEDLVEIYMDKKCEPKISKLSNPERLIIDFYGMTLKSGDAALNHGGACYTNIRYANHDGNYARIVVDIAVEYSYTIKTDDEKCSLSLVKKSDGTSVQTPPATSTPNLQNPTENTTIPVSPAEIGKYLVVIDPGHGGSDPGAIGKLDGKNVCESEVNLDISLKVKAILEANGISVAMTRTDDTFVGLVERAQYANNLKSALFICIHNNSAVIDTAHGSGVYYYTGATDNNTKVSYGITSREVAQLVQNAVIASAARYNRGIEDGSNLAVLHRTVMPAVLVECAFLSNEEECKLLTNDSFRQKLADGIAKGVIDSLRMMGKL